MKTTSRGATPTVIVWPRTEAIEATTRSRPKSAGFEDFGGHAEELAPIAIRWADGTPISSIGILGDPSQWAEEAQREELRNLAENVVLLNDYRGRKRDDYRTTL